MNNIVMQFQTWHLHISVKGTTSVNRTFVLMLPYAMPTSPQIDYERLASEIITNTVPMFTSSLSNPEAP